MKAMVVVHVLVLCVLVTMTSSAHLEITYTDPNAITCYTCPGMANNTQCNKWAPDVPCPIEGAICKTAHRMSPATGSSIHVVKSCSLPEHCTIEHVGCHDTDTEDEIECVSCCSVSYCNVAVPVSASTSHKLSASLNADSSSAHVSRVSSVLLMACVSFFLWYSNWS